MTSLDDRPTAHAQAHSNHTYLNASPFIHIWTDFLCLILNGHEWADVLFVVQRDKLSILELFN